MSAKRDGATLEEALMHSVIGAFYDVAMTTNLHFTTLASAHRQFAALRSSRHQLARVR